MNRLLKYLLILTLSFELSALSLSCYAAYEDIGCGARPIGIGNAFCALADDADAFLYNPAGLVQLRKLQVSAMYANLFPGLSDKSVLSNNFLAVAYPMGQSAFGIAWFNLSAVSDPERANASYQENTYFISYARSMDQFSMGFSARIHTKEYGQSYWTDANPVFQKKKGAYGLGIDAGIMYKSLDKKFRFGLFASDINQPDMGIASPSPVPIAVRTGIAYKFDPVGVFNDITGTADATYRDRDYKIQGGLEGWFLDRSVAVRMGGGFGSNLYGNISVGASYQLTEEMYNNDFRIDYAFTYPLGGLQPTGGTHRISLTMGFDVK